MHYMAQKNFSNKDVPKQTAIDKPPGFKTLTQGK